MNESTFQALTEYIKKVAEKIVRGEGSSNVVSGNILSVLPGEYEVQLINGENTSPIKATSLNESQSFKKDDTVFLISSEFVSGGISETKYFIFGLVSVVQENYAQLTDWERFEAIEDAQYETTGTIYVFENGDKDITTIDSTTIGGQQVINALKINGWLAVAATFNLPEDVVTTFGNYGLRFDFYNGDQLIESQNLDTGWFVGQAYKLRDSKQHRVIHFGEKAASVNKIKVSAFSIGFNSGVYTNDFYVKDLIVQVGKLIEIFDNFSVSIERNGAKDYFYKDLDTAVIDEKNTVSLKAIAKYNNQILSSDSLKYYWFVESDEVTDASSDGFSFVGGPGWYCLNDFEYPQINNDGDISEDTSIKIWNTTQQHTFTIGEDKLVLFEKYKNKVKCVVGYQLNNFTSNELEIINLNNEAFYAELSSSDSSNLLVQETDEIVLTCKVKNENVASDKNLFYYEWLNNNESTSFFLSVIDGETVPLKNIARDNSIYLKVAFTQDGKTIEKELYFDKEDEVLTDSDDYKDNPPMSFNDFLEKYENQNIKITGFDYKTDSMSEFAPLSEDSIKINSEEKVFFTFNLESINGEDFCFLESKIVYENTLSKETEIKFQNIYYQTGFFGKNNTLTVNNSFFSTSADTAAIKCNVYYYENSPLEKYKIAETNEIIIKSVINVAPLLNSEERVYYYLAEVKEKLGPQFRSLTNSSDGPNSYEYYERADSVGSFLNYEKSFNELKIDEDIFSDCEQTKQYYLYYCTQEILKEDKGGVIKELKYYNWTEPKLLRWVKYENSDWVDLITDRETEQFNTFNNLTRGGRDQGIFYDKNSEFYFITDDTSPQSGKTYYTSDGKNYTKFDGSAFKDGIVYYEQGNTNLYINASMIRTGALQIGEGSEEKFYANKDTGEVRISGEILKISARSNAKTNAKNLLLNSNFYSLENWSHDSNYVTIDSNKTILGNNSVKIEVNGLQQNSYAGITQSFKNRLKQDVGTKFVFSCWLYVDEELSKGAEVRCYFQYEYKLEGRDKTYSTWNSIASNLNNNLKTWQYFSNESNPYEVKSIDQIKETIFNQEKKTDSSITLDDIIDLNLKNVFCNINVVQNGTLYVSSPKVELGTVASEWTAAPEELSNIEAQIQITNEKVETNVSDLNGKYSNLKQTVDGFETRVESVEGNYSTLEQDVNEITARVGDVEDQSQANFNILSNRIDAKVENQHTGTSFSWELTDTNHIWKSNNDEVMRVDGNGLSLTGTITALGGSIGGWNINGEAISNSTTVSVSTVGMSPGLSISGTKYCFWAGGQPASAPFSVTQDGSLKASRGNIANFDIADGFTSLDGQLKINTNEISILNPASKFICGNFYFVSSGSSNITSLCSTGPIRILAANGVTGLAFEDEEGNQTQTFSLYIFATIDSADTLTLQAKCGSFMNTSGVFSEKNVELSVQYTFYWQLAWSDIFGTKMGFATNKTQTTTFIINPGEASSQVNTYNCRNLVQGFYGLRFSNDNSFDSATAYYADGLLYTLNNKNVLSKQHTQKIPKDIVRITGHMVPSVNGTYNLGNQDNKWNTIYAQTSGITGSNKNEKNSIQYMIPAYEIFFDNLKPVSYKLNKNTSNRTHIGFIAQDVKEAIENAGLTTKEFAGYCEWGGEENNDFGCGLRYEEFIALCVDQIQKLKVQIAELEREINKENK